MDDKQRQDWWPDPEHTSNTDSASPTPQQEYPNAADSWNQPRQNPDAWNSSPNPRQENTDNQYDNPNPFQNSYQQQNNYQYQNTYRQQPGNSMSTAALVMGILSLVTMCCGLGIAFGALGILFALFSRKREPMNGQAKAGLGLSIAGMVLSVFLFGIIFAEGIREFPDFLSEPESFLEEYYDYDQNNSNNLDHYLDDYLDPYGDSPLDNFSEGSDAL